MNLDEINCPACNEKPLMDVLVTQKNGADVRCRIECPNCGFTIAARSTQTAELAVRCLQDTLWHAIALAFEAEHTGTHRRGFDADAIAAEDEDRPRARPDFLSQALNEGDGTYRP